MQIAIDGPAGAGKSTVAKLVASKLGYTYIDTGAMYRALTYQVIRAMVDLNNEDQVAVVLANMDLKLAPSSTNEQPCLVLVDNEDVTQHIREQIVTQHVSTVSSHAKVRSKMVALQQQLGVAGNVVMDGRDIGTTVLPNAELKIFLQASVEERARRRLIDLSAQGYDLTFEGLITQIRARDHQDSTRKVSPLCKAIDAIEVDTTSQEIDEVVEIILSLARRRGADV